MGTESMELREFRAEMGRRSLMPTSINKRISILLRCETALDHPLIDATTDELRDWLDAHRLVARSRYSYISHLASFWRWALIEERATRNPTLRLTRPKMRRSLPRPVSREDFLYVLDQAPTKQLRAMVALAGYAGLRCIEIATLDVSDIMEHLDPPVLVVTHGKGDKPRVQPMPAAIIDALRAHGMPAHGAVFRDDDGEQLSAGKVSHLLRSHMHNCGVIASGHQLRHGYGTEVYNRSGNDLRMTQELLGHASPGTTAAYVAWAQHRAAAVVAELFT
jgi:integrase/recombinase XerC